MAMNETEYNKLICSIFDIMLKDGIKNLKMDGVATTLGISKRTLYEIFVSKADMIMKTMHHMGDRFHHIADEIFSDSPNYLIAMIRVFTIQRHILCILNNNLFLDMGRLYPDVKAFYIEETDLYYHKNVIWYQQGVEQGLLCDNIDYNLQLKILQVQIESLKRMENLFPPGITLIQAYDAMSIGFLRSITSPKGRVVLEEAIKDIDNTTKGIEKYLFTI